MRKMMYTHGMCLSEGIGVALGKTNVGELAFIDKSD
jgi:hypothetical protein